MTTKVPEWPVIQVTINDEGGEVTVPGTSPIEFDAEGLSDARKRALELLTAQAQRLRRPVRARAIDESGSWPMVVYPDGRREKDDKPAPRPRPPAGYPAAGIPTAPSVPAVMPRQALRPVTALVVTETPRPMTPPTAARVVSRPLVLVAAGALACLAVGGTVGWLVHGVAVKDPAIIAAPPEESQAAAAAWEQRRSSLQGEVDAGRSLLTQTEGAVIDPATRDELARQLAAATAVLDATSEAEPPVHATREGDDVVLTVDPDWDPGYTTSSNAVAAATTDVTNSNAQWAHDGLTAAIQAGQGTYNGTAGQVDDEGLRQTLSDSIASGQSVWDAGAGATPPADSLAARDGIAAAAAAVEASQASWARSQLGAAIQSASLVLVDSDGRVPDNSVRDNLFLQIQHGQGLWDAGDGGAGVADTLAARDAINAAAGVVQTSIVPAG